MYFAEDADVCTEQRGDSPDNREECDIEFTSESDIQFNFVNNTAGESGSILYGGKFDSCDDDIYSTLKNRASIDSATNDITPTPFQVCPCEVFPRNCKNEREMKINATRGREFDLQVAIVSRQQGHYVPHSYVRDILDNDADNIIGTSH